LPVTARLSRKFYERFGDEIAGEFVDWFNAVDSTYQQQLRDQNDLNWERFKAELHSAIAQSESRLIERIVQSESGLTEKFSGKLSEFSGKLSEFSGKLSDLKADLMKWMFIYWCGTMLSVAGLLTVLLRKG
jgi:hypothetical protein